MGWIQDTGYRIHLILGLETDREYRIQDTANSRVRYRYRIQLIVGLDTDREYRIQLIEGLNTDTEYSIPDTYRIQNTGYRINDIG